MDTVLFPTIGNAVNVQYSRRILVSRISIADKFREVGSQFQYLLVTRIKICCRLT